MRYVYPLKVNGELIGYIELGREIEHITLKFKEVLGADVAFLINKKFVSKESWQEGAKLFNKTTDWDLLKNYIITSSTLPYSQELASKINIRTKKFKIKVGNKTHQCSLDKLVDASGKSVGYLLVSNDITQEISTIDDTKQRFIIVGSTIFIILFLLLWYYISGIEKFVAQSFNQIKQQSKEIENSLEEKRVMLKEIHHRVKNNLQVITGLLSLQSNFIDNDEVIGHFRYSQHRIKAIAMIHEMLYQSQGLSNISCQDYLTELVNYIAVSFRGNKNDIHIDIKADISLNIDTAVPLGLLINEIVTNSFKYGFKDKTEGTISIFIEQLNSSNYKMHISDYGVGYGSELNHKTSDSLGLKLIQKLSLQLKGNIEKENTAKGTHYVLTFQKIS